MHLFERHRRQQYKPRDKRKFYDWAKGINLPAAYSFKGSFDIDLSPWLRKPGDALEDPLIREVNCVAAVRTGKTLLGDLFLAKKAATDRAPMMFNIGDEQNANEHSKLRFRPLLESIPQVAEQFSKTNRFAVTDSLVQFSDGTYILIQGLENPNNFDAKGICWMVNDEVHKAKRGNLDKARSRTDDFRHKCKILNISQGGIKDDDGDLSYRAGTQERWGFRCLKCRMLQPFEFRDEEGNFRLKWDSNEMTRPGGQWDYDAMAATIRYECANPECRHEHHDTPEERREMCGTANCDYLPPLNPLAPRDQRSFTWNQLCAPWVPWREIVVAWLKAMAAYEAGDTSALKNIIQRRFAEFWNEFETRIGRDEDTPESDYVIVEDNGRFPNLPCGFPWDKEAERSLTIDVQEGGGRYYVGGAAAFARDGESRVLWAGRMESWEEVRAKQLELNIQGSRVGVDVGDGNAAHEIQAVCARYQWIAMAGDDRRTWSHPDPSGKSGPMIELPFSRPKEIWLARGQRSDVQGSRFCIQIYWSNPIFHGIHHRRLSGKGLYYGVPADIEDYATYTSPENKKPTGFWKQMRANQLKTTIDKETGERSTKWIRIGNRPDHYRDVRCMLLAMSAIRGCLGVELLADDTK